MPTTRPAALVTGASSGIGEGFARHLARTGHDLILVARRADRLEELADALCDAHDIDVEVLAADLSTSKGIATVAARLTDGDPVDLFVNNAGFAARGAVGALDVDALDQMVALNITAFTHLADAAMRGMRAGGRGTIINVGSGTLFMQLPGNAGYGATKAYVAYFTRTMQAEAQDSGIRVQLLIPGVIATEFHTVAGNDLSNFPADRVMQVDDLVVASLRALEMEEPVCIPSLPDIADWDAWMAAEAKITPNASRDRRADRYH